MKVPFLELLPTYQELKEEIDAAYHRVMDSGWYLLGKETAAFEEEFSAFCHVGHAVGVANGLDALRLLMQADGIGPGDQVLVPANTFIATFLAVSQTGAEPVPVEPKAATANIDPEAAEKALTPKTRAIIAVHLYGQCAEMVPLRELADRKGLRLYEDAAQAHGATYQGRPAGSLADAAGFSFYPGKNLGSYSDAGAVATNDARIAAKVRELRNYGSTVKYHHESVGINSRMDELQAAFLRVKLRHLPEWNQRRQRAAAFYRRELSGVVDLQLPEVAEGCDPVWHIFAVHHPRRDALQSHLATCGVQAQIHYPIPSHLSGAYHGILPYGEGAFPVTERLAATELSLPIGPHIANEQYAFVCESVRSFV